ncbi:Fic/DOC family protein [Kitasatospora sp. NPDC101801]|uniref:Fic/DOC family protein n=1 Tax=Kitasatospora sp. NPDC101801 TaxID=3364103 RepID=UPI0037FE0ABC
MSDPYALPNGTLRNLLGIDDAAQLAAAEADITRATLSRIAEHPVPGRFDLAHLRAVHQAVFGLVYAWAGKLRTVEISKHTGFCPLRNLEPYADEIFSRAPSPAQLAAASRSDLVDTLTELYGDINALHPFREGNGRAQRAFLGQLASESDWLLSWDNLDPAENQLASIRSFQGDNTLLHKMVDDLVS